MSHVARMRRKIHAGFWLENLKEGECSERIILKGIFKEYVATRGLASSGSR